MGALKDLTSAQSGLIGAGLETGSAIVNAVLQSRENKRNRAFAQQQAEQARKWQIEQWQMENAYNTPSAQMQRYLAAGLNPNLIYGDVGSALGGTAPSVPQGDSVSQPSPNIGNLSLNSVQQGLLMDAQIERMDIQNENEKLKTNAEVAKIWSDKGLTDAEAKEVVQRTANLVKEGRLLSLNIQGARYSNKKSRYEAYITSESADAVIQKLRADAGISEAQAKAAVDYWTKLLLGMDVDRRKDLSDILTNKAIQRLDTLLGDLYDQQARYQKYKNIADFGTPNIHQNLGSNLYTSQIQSVIDMNNAYSSTDPTWQNINDDLDIVGRIVMGIQYINKITEPKSRGKSKGKRKKK